MEQVVIESLRPEEIPEAASVLASAMASNPIHMAVLGGQEGTERDLQEAFSTGAFGRLKEGALVARQEGAIAGVLGKTRWPRCHFTSSEAEQLLPALQAIFGDRAPRILDWRLAWGKHDPGEAHWHLGPFGVLPAKQGRGIGSQLLRRLCQEVDGLGEAAYLETDKAQDVTLYQRFGFVVNEEALVLGVHTWFMWRPPQRKDKG